MCAVVAIACYIIVEGSDRQSAWAPAIGQLNRLLPTETLRSPAHLPKLRDKDDAAFKNVMYKVLAPATLTYSAPIEGIMLSAPANSGASAFQSFSSVLAAVHVAL